MGCVNTTINIFLVAVVVLGGVFVDGKKKKYEPDPPDPIDYDDLYPPKPDLYKPKPDKYPPYGPPDPDPKYNPWDPNYKPTMSKPDYGPPEPDDYKPNPEPEPYKPEPDLYPPPDYKPPDPEPDYKPPEPDSGYKPEKPGYGPVPDLYLPIHPPKCKPDNICEKRGYKCCACADCTSDAFGCAETCACCPRDHVCCKSGVKHHFCCPRGSQCDNIHGVCITVRKFKPTTKADIFCGCCDNLYPPTYPVEEK